MMHGHTLRGRLRLKALIAPAAASFFLIAGTAQAAQTYNVTRDDDTTTTCSASDCSLRGAVLAANSDGTDSVVDIPSGMHVKLDLSSASSELDITNDGTFTLNGGGARSTTIDGGGTADSSLTYENSARIFHIISNEAGPANATINDVTVTGGSYGDDGAAFYVDSDQSLRASLTLNRDNVSGNENGSDGGAIYSEGTVTVNDSTFTNNWTEGDGAAIQDNAGVNDVSIRIGTTPLSLSITNSTFTSNTSDSNAGCEGEGAIDLNSSSAHARIVNSTIANNVDPDGSCETNVDADGNEVPAGGLGIEDGSADVVNTVLSGNESPGIGGESRFADPTLVEVNCGGPINSLGHNVETKTDCGFKSDGDQQNTDPKLAALADNGGQTDTMALLDSSPAIDKADSTNCPPADQRGVGRPQGAACDVGAYEVQVPVVNQQPARFPALPASTPNSCKDTRKYKFTLHHAPHARVVSLKVYVNGTLRVKKSGHSIKKFTLAKLPTGVFTVKIVGLQNTGSTLTSVRKYDGCTKTRPKVRGHHAHPHHHHHHHH